MNWLWTILNTPYIQLTLLQHVGLWVGVIGFFIVVVLLLMVGVWVLDNYIVKAGTRR